MAPAEKKKKAEDVSTGRIITQNEFELIQKHQARKEVDSSKGNKKRRHVEIEEQEINRFVGLVLLNYL